MQTMPIRQRAVAQGWPVAAPLRKTCLSADTMADTVFPMIETSLFRPADGAMVMRGKAPFRVPHATVGTMQAHGLGPAHLPLAHLLVDTAILHMQAIVHLIPTRVVGCKGAVSVSRGQTARSQESCKGDDDEFHGFHGVSFNVV